MSTSVVIDGPSYSLHVTDPESSETVITGDDGPLVVISAGGQPGQKGDPGAAAEIHAMSSAATWAITHNLGRYPLVQCLDDTGELFDADVECPDVNTVVITHATPRSGTVLIA